MISLTPTQKQKIAKAASSAKKRQLFFRFCYPQIEAVIYADQTDQVITIVIQKYSLDENQYALISRLVLECLTGGLPINQFSSAFLQQSNIPDNIAQQVAAEIQQAVLEPIRPLLEKAYQEFPQIQHEFMAQLQTQPVTTPSTQPTPTTDPSTTPNWPTSNRVAPAPDNLPIGNLAPAQTQQAQDKTPQPSQNLPLRQTQGINSVPSQPATQNPQPINPPTAPSQDIRALAKKNPAILEQQITGGYLTEAGTGTRVLATVKNWLLDYTRVAGAIQHSDLDRARYLLKSPNAKNLTEEERRLVSKIIESYDIGSPLIVDINTGLLLLPNKRLNFQQPNSNDVHTFRVQPVSFGNIIDLQEF